MRYPAGYWSDFCKENGGIDCFITADFHENQINNIL